MFTPRLTRQHNQRRLTHHVNQRYLTGAPRASPGRTALKASEDPMSDKASPLSPILKLGEEKLTQLLTQLLANEGFVAALQGAISTGLKAKGGLDKGLISILSAFNVPTVEDVQLMKTKIGELEDALADLGGTVEKLQEKLKGGADKPKARKGKKHSEHGAED